MATTIGGLATTLIKDPNIIIKELNKVKENKEYEKLTALYNLLSQSSQQEQSQLQALEKAKKYHRYSAPIDIINTYLNYADLYSRSQNEELKAKMYLDTATQKLGKLSKIDKMKKILELCELYLAIESPLDVLDLARTVKRADDKNYFSLLLYKSKAQRYLERYNEALSTLTQASGIGTLSHSAWYRCKIVGEMSKIYKCKNDAENESKLKAQYFKLKNEEELQISDESLSDEDLDIPEMNANYICKFVVHHKSIFYTIESFELNIESKNSKLEILKMAETFLRKKLKIPRLVVKQINLPKQLFNTCTIDLILSSSSLPSITDLYRSSFGASINPRFLEKIKSLNLQDLSFNLAYLQMKDKEFEFLCNFIPPTASILQLQHNLLTDKIFKHLDRFTKLRELDISNNCIKGAMSISAVSMNASCWTDASITSISPNTANLILNLCEFQSPTSFDALLNSSIYSLSLRECIIGSHAYYSLKMALQSLKQLKELDLSGIDLEEQVCLSSIPQSVVKLSLDLLEFREVLEFQLPNLKILSMKFCSFTESSEDSFCEYITRYPPRQLFLCNTKISVSNLAKLKSKMHVKE